MVGVDGSDSSIAALRCAAEVARGLGARVWVVHVRYFPAAWSPELAARHSLDNVYDSIEEGARARGDEVLGKSDVQWTFEVRPGEPAEELERAAKEHEGELIVVGTHGFRAAERFFLGSTSTRLVHHTTHSVMVVR